MMTVTLDNFFQYSNIQEFIEEVEEFNKQLQIDELDDKRIAPKLIITMENIRQSLKGIMLIVERKNVYDDITKLDHIKAIIDVHQKLLGFVSHEDCPQSYRDSLNQMIHRMNSLYALFLIGKVLKSEPK